MCPGSLKNWLARWGLRSCISNKLSRLLLLLVVMMGTGWVWDHTAHTVSGKDAECVWQKPALSTYGSHFSNMMSDYNVRWPWSKILSFRAQTQDFPRFGARKNLWEDRWHIRSSQKWNKLNSKTISYFCKVVLITYHQRGNSRRWSWCVENRETLGNHIKAARALFWRSSDGLV